MERGDIGVSVIIPIGQRKLIAQTVQSLFLQGVVDMEIMIVYNGQYGNISLDYSSLYNPLDIPLFQINITAKGKGFAINTGIMHSRYPIVAVIDADCVVSSDAFHHILRHFQKRDVIAAGGRLKILEPESLLQKIQRIEYEKVFNCSRLFFNAIKGDFLISGAFSFFRKDALELLNGFSTDTVGEDMDVVLNLQRCFRSRGK